MKDLSWLSSVRAERLSGSTRNPGFAALLSFFVMGLGQIYAGHVDRGLFFIVVQLSGGFCGYSLYSKGIVYEALMGYLTQGALISLVYVFSVVLILLWIYNIKDAYYLSLFAGFRDWFEIERMVIPMLTNYKTNLIAYDGPGSDADLSGQIHPTKGAPSPGGAPGERFGDPSRIDTIEVKQIKKNPRPEEKDVEDAIPAYVSKKTRSKKSSSGPSSKKGKRKSEGPPPSLEWNLDFRFYGAFAAILILCGLIFLKNYMSVSTKEEKKDEPGAFISLNQDFSLSLATETVAMLATKTEAIATLSSEEALINGIALVKNGSFSAGAEEIEKVMQVREVKP